MSNDIIKPQNEQLPAYLQDETTYGDELMGKYVRPPRIKIVQAQAREPYDQFDPGTVVITPAMVKIAEFDKATKKGDIWRFVPLFFFPEWCKWNPLELAGDEPMIAERTFDPNDEIAQKAQSAETWEEPCEKGGKYRYAEHLNFIIAPLDDQYLGMQFALTFVRAEMRTGANLCALIRMRNAPLCAQIFQAQVGHRKNAKGNWYGLDCTVPTDGDMFVQDKQLYDAFKAQHLKYAEAHREQAIQIDHDDQRPASTEETEF